jgi:hypothetical protein
MLNRRQFVGAGVAAVGLAALPVVASDKINIIRVIETHDSIYINYKDITEVAAKHICNYLGQDYNDDNKNLIIGPYNKAPENLISGYILVDPTEEHVYVKFHNATDGDYYPEGRLVKSYFYSWNEVVEKQEGDFNRASTDGLQSIGHQRVSHDFTV